MFRTLDEAMAAWEAHAPMHIENGAIALDSIRSYITPAMKRNAQFAMDAAPALTTTPSSAIPVFLTTLMDPDVFKVLFAKNKGADILGEKKKGTWLDSTAMFPTVEHTGEVSSYGDYNENGMSGVNTNFPNRQSYLFQVVKQYGEREMEMAGLAKINFVSEIDQAAALSLNKYSNLTYFFGVAGLLNYGILNDPSLPAVIAPSLKAYGGTAWIVGGVVMATANEIFTDLQSLFSQLVSQTQDLIDEEVPLTLALSPGAAVALTQTNTFNVNVTDLLKKNFPNITFERAVQYGALTTLNPQGLAGGNLVQMIAKSIESQDTGYCAFNEKMRMHKIIPAMSSFRQKVTGGTWGAIIRAPYAIAGLQGV